MPSITEKVIESLDSLMASSASIQEIHKQLKEEEPVLLRWCEEGAQNDVTMFMRGGAFMNTDMIRELGSRLTLARMSGYLLAQMGRTHTLLNELSLKLTDGGIDVDVDREYDMWVTGKLGPEHYAYEITEEMLKSTAEDDKAMIAAKNAHMEYAKQQEEEEQIKQAREHKKDIMRTANMKAGVKTKSGDSAVVKKTRRSKSRGLSFDDPSK